jgi:hypothetical protein
MQIIHTLSIFSINITMVMQACFLPYKNMALLNYKYTVHFRFQFNRHGTAVISNA